MTVARWAALTFVASAALSSVAHTQTPSCQRSAFKLLRYEEDYRFLRNSSCRSQATDAFKYIDLGGDSAAFISVGGMARHRYEVLRNVDWGRGIADHDGYLLARYMLHADIHVRRARVFAEVASHRIDGRTGGPRPTDADAFDLHQAFVEVGSGSATLRFGRQEIVFGSERLVSVRDGPNIRRSFDGVRATARSNGWQTDAFVLLPVRVERGAFDNRAEPDQSFWGMHGTKAVVATRFNVDLYYFGLENSRARFQQGVGRERRHSVGSRGFGRVGRLDYDIELVEQWGTFESGAISAWTAASNVGYTVGGWAGRPRFGLKADVTSGDDDPADGSLQTFNPLFPRGGYFGLASLIGPQNHVDLHPSLDLHVTPRLVVTGDWDFFWRESLADGLYAISGALQVAANGNRERYVGHQPSLSAMFRVNPHIRMISNVGRFVAGPFVKQMNLRSVDYLMLWFDLHI